MSPSASWHIATNKIDPAQLRGTGKHGIITKTDVLLFLQHGSPPSAAPAHAAAAPAPPAPAAAPAPAPPQQQTATAPPPSSDGARGFTDLPVSGMRRTIATRLQESKSQVPHFYASASCDVSKLLAMRKALNGIASAPISVNDFVLRGCALALRDVPAANVFWDEATGSVQPQASVDISVAVATEGGLITPIVKHVDAKSLSAISAEVKEIAGRARQLPMKLKPEEYMGGSFTISNLGMFGMDEFSAVINPPQACIMAVSGSSREFVLAENAEGEKLPVAADVMTVTLSCDGRAVDPHTAARYLQVFKAYVDDPQLMML